MALLDGRPPDVLVLGGGGLLGEAWMSGLLAGLEAATGAEPTQARAFVGTSAGSIVAARLASGQAPRGPGGGPEPAVPRPAGGGAAAGGDGAARGGGAEGAGDGAARGGGRVLAARVGLAALRRVGGAAGAFGAVAAPAGLAAAAPAGALVRAGVLSRIPAGRRSLADLRDAVDGWGAELDGRLLICAVDRRAGRRVVFGAPGAPAASAGEAVQASCAVPGVFAPVTIGGRVYVDGGAWSPANGDAAPAGRGDRVLLLEPTAVLLRGALRGASAVEAAALRRRGATVVRVAPDRHAAPLMARLLDPDRDGRVRAAGHRQGLALGGAAPA